MPVNIDVSASSILVSCTDCPQHPGLASTIESAHDLAVEHEALVHPGVFQAAKARNAHRRRLARHAV